MEAHDAGSRDRDQIEIEIRLRRKGRDGRKGRRVITPMIYPEGRGGRSKGKGKGGLDSESGLRWRWRGGIYILTHHHPSRSHG